MHPETLRKRVRQAEADSGARPDLPSTVEREEIRTVLVTDSVRVDVDVRLPTR